MTRTGWRQLNRPTWDTAVSMKAFGLATALKAQSGIPAVRVLILWVDTETAAADCLLHQNN